MSFTIEERVPSLEKWLHLNAFWNADLLEIKKSKQTDGLGVYLRPLEVEDEDRLLLRIPKENVLSSKNSCIANLIVDYSTSETEKIEQQEISEDEEDVSIDLAQDLHSLVLSVIYEQSLGPESPWYDYLNSIDFENSLTPVCLWSDEDKKILQNSECDLLHMLETDEIVELYKACIQFANANSKFLKVPSVLEANQQQIDGEFADEQSRKNLIQFGKILQTVLSRSFPIDVYHGLSLVPGADLFNHDIGDVEFVREEDICEECGEKECDHQEDDDEESDDEEIDEEELEEILRQEQEEDSDEEDEEIEALIDSTAAETEESVPDDVEDIEMALESELVSSEDEFGSEEELDEELDEKPLENEEETGTEELNEDEEDEEKEEVISEITEDYIKQMELDIEAEEQEDAFDEEDIAGSESEGKDEDAVSLLELSDDEGDDGNPVEDDLGKQLATDQCCDIILLNPNYGEELFNSYGDLSNPYLLQRYGFVEEDNVSISCMLTVQMFSHFKKITGQRGIQLDIKLQWYEEIGFELVNDLLRIGLQDNQAPGDCCGEKEEGCCEKDEEDCCDKDDDESCGDDGEDDDDEIDNDEPISWELSPKVLFDGSPTPQTYALLRLFLMPFNLFQAKFLHCQSEPKLCRRILTLLLPNGIPITHPRIKKEHEQVFKILNSWCRTRLSKYKDGLTTDNYEKLLKESTISREKRIIFSMLKQEKELLARGAAFTVDDWKVVMEENLA